MTYTPSAVGSRSHTITASYGGDAFHNHSSDSQPVTVIGAAPGAPTVTSLSNGDGQVGVGFTDANPGARRSPHTR